MFFYREEMDGTYYEEVHTFLFDGAQICFLDNNDSIVEDVKIFNLIDPSCQKVFLKLEKGFFHAVSTTLAQILIEHEKNNNVQIILGIDSKDSFGDIFNKFIVDTMKRKNIKYKIILLENNTIYKIDKCLYFSMTMLTYSGIKIIEKLGLEYSSNNPPYKKIILTRKLVHRFAKSPEGMFGGIDPNKFLFKDDIRMDNEDKVINYFEKLGFECISPENFKSIEEQIRFFSEVKTIVSVTTAGLLNTVFMPQGSKVIELAVPMVAGRTESLHSNLYSGISFAKNHKYIAIPTMRKAEDVIKIIENDISLKKYIAE